jgi:hypothetical protein
MGSNSAIALRGVQGRWKQKNQRMQENSGVSKMGLNNGWEGKENLFGQKRINDRLFSFFQQI